MRNTTVYEWTVESLDDCGDIIESDFDDKLANLSFDLSDSAVSLDYGLVRRAGNEIEGENENRLYAYVKDGKLPEFFSDELGVLTGYAVPKKFQKEFQLFVANVTPQ